MNLTNQTQHRCWLMSQSEIIEYSSGCLAYIFEAWMLSSPYSSKYFGHSIQWSHLYKTCMIVPLTSIIDTHKKEQSLIYNLNRSSQKTFWLTEPISAATRLHLRLEYLFHLSTRCDNLMRQKVAKQNSNAVNKLHTLTGTQKPLDFTKTGPWRGELSAIGSISIKNEFN